MLKKGFLNLGILAVVEVFITIYLSSILGGLNSILWIIFTAIAGICVLKRNMAHISFSNFGMLDINVISRVTSIIAGVMLIIPGILSDFVGLMLLLPFTRRYLVMPLINLMLSKTFSKF